MKRIVLLLIAGFFLAIYVLSNNTAWMKATFDYRNSPTALLPTDKHKFGDLYVFSYLPEFRQRKFVAEDLKPYYFKGEKKNNVNLYAICDSYLYDFLLNDSLLSHADSYRFTRWNFEAKQFHLNPAKKNILLLESVERHVRSIFPDTALVFKHIKVVDDASKESISEVNELPWAKKYFFSRIFNKNIEQNLEFSLFDFPFFIPFKELKAQLNYQIFGRKNKDVFVSQSRNQLYYTPTIDSTTVFSSFNYLPEKELDTLLVRLNYIYHHYRQAGFSEVYLAIMPNPVTILEPALGTYNGLIPRIQQNKVLQMPVINTYSKLNQLKAQPIYQPGDTHWNKTGFLAGIAQIDSALATKK